MKWRVVSDAVLHFRTWDDESVVYNSLSGDVHLLGSAAAQILLNLQRGPSDTAALIASLAPILQAAPDESLSIQVDRILGDLKALSLIECA